MAAVRISSASMRQRFNGCDPDYIANVCHASCCRTSAHPSGIRVAVHISDRAAIEARGAAVDDDGMMVPRSGEKRCPFQDGETHLCGLHFTPDKPFSCIASPFSLAPGGRTLIVRNRWRKLKCYEDGARLPAYVAFRSSLDLLFGAAQAAAICAHLEAGGGDLDAEMDERVKTTLEEIAATRKAGKAQ